MFNKKIIINKINWDKKAVRERTAFCHHIQTPPYHRHKFLKIPFEVRKSLTPTTRTLDVKRLSIMLPTHTHQKLGKRISRKTDYLKTGRASELEAACRTTQGPAGLSVPALCAGSSSQERTRSSSTDWGSPNKCKAPVHWPKLFLPTELLLNI